jgi:hypothetical protein
VTANAPSIFEQVFRGSGGGKRIALLISAYFDESAEGDSQNGLLAICGYALDDRGVRGLSRAWDKMLNVYGIPYFHMNECNTCTGIFDHLTDRSCDLCARRAIKLARKYPLHGHAFVVDQREYRRILESQGFDCDPYSFLVFTAFIHVNKWIIENRPEFRVSLYFEKGYRTQKRANDLLDAVSDWRMNKVVNYGFVDKDDCGPSQAGDLVAWHVRKGYENIRKGKPVRRDTEALLQDRIVSTIDFHPTRLESLRDHFIKKAGSLENAAKLIFSPASGLVSP